MFQDGVKKTILSASFIPAVGYSRDKEPWPASATALCPQANREIWQTGHWFPSLTFQQFQVLFNSLFKVLCIFPSRYLCAIGLPPIFSFRWNLPPALCCNPKQHDSIMKAQKHGRTGVSPSMLPCSKGLRPSNIAITPQYFGLSSSLFTRRYWGNPG